MCHVPSKGWRMMALHNFLSLNSSDFGKWIRPKTFHYAISYIQKYHEGPLIFQKIKLVKTFLKKGF